ncbi:MAG: RagB/SusD domain protein [Ferruginibacter sp.]|uniref:RagB/SusD family nutrient uptake outer membrane protein n=1 Tax=Ferruginibacter sp. TaxID=1940288 RepID=UPI0026580876|nr:RagB/SusD family nutrient uptake outer membrane protein [Ferruginibacter sp.]MDB5275692.1 RagB/SusD domain protein [Ferruginibacter sp.]
MKSIYKILAALVIFCTAGCSKELHKTPIGIITEGIPPTHESVIYSVTSSYQLLSSTLNIIGNWGWDDGTVLRNDFIMQDIASGDMLKKWNPDGDQAWMDQFADFSFTSSNSGVKGQWSYDYAGIARTNLAISYLTDATLTASLGIDETLRKSLLGQVYFLRAFYYFDLVNLYGDVPLLTAPLKNFADAYSVAKRETKANVYVQISKDLADAKSLLPDGKYAAADEKWRVSKGAVMAMQAKVALYNQQWADVITAVTEMESLNYYSLDHDYFDNFSVAKEFAENEVVFAYDHKSLTTPRTGNGLCALAGWGFIAPSPSFIAAFEPNDPRLGLTVDVAGQNVYKIFGELNSNNKGNDDAPSNKIYIRWADVQLWKAEALNETGNYPAAIAIINSIRQRARTSPNADGTMPPAGTLPDRDVTSVSKDQIRTWLIQERRVELGFESQRFNDLKRWGIAKTFLTGLGKNFQDKNYLYPIPQGEIDKSGGSITQNTGY